MRSAGSREPRSTSSRQNNLFQPSSPRAPPARAHQRLRSTASDTVQPMYLIIPQLPYPFCIPRSGSEFRATSPCPRASQAPNLSCKYRCRILLTGRCSRLQLPPAPNPAARQSSPKCSPLPAHLLDTATWHQGRVNIAATPNNSQQAIGGSWRRAQRSNQSGGAAHTMAAASRLHHPVRCGLLTPLHSR